MLWVWDLGLFCLCVWVFSFFVDGVSFSMVGGSPHLGCGVCPWGVWGWCGVTCVVTFGC